MAFTIQSLVGVIETYLAYGVITTTDLSYCSMLSFPAITICNQNKLIRTLASPGPFVSSINIVFKYSIVTAFMIQLRAQASHVHNI